MLKVTKANETLFQSAKDSWKYLKDMKTKLKEVVSREEALKTKLATVKNFAKTLHEEIERLNKEFDLFKVTT